MRIETKAVHAGFDHDPTTGALAVPIHQTAAFAFDSADHAAALFNLEEPGFRYSRISNPTVSVLEERVASLEGGVAALCLGSGMAALQCALLTAAEGGGSIVSVPQLYGTTYSLLASYLPSLGIEVRFAAGDSAAEVAAVMDASTRAVFCESVGNPAGNIADLKDLATVAHAHGVPLIVDNTVPTPILLRPIEHGADVVVASLTKFMGGHGTTLGGVVVDGGTFDWMAQSGKYRALTTPDQAYHGLVFVERYGAAAFAERCRAVQLRHSGAALSPFNAFLLLQGIETVALRMERHVDNARKVAEFLRGDARVDWVNYTGFDDHPHHPLVKIYMDGRPSPLLTFGVQGGYAGGALFYNALKLVRRVVNLGDTKTLACHPASTTHRQMPLAAQIKAGVLPEAIRISVGIEHIDDILTDLDQALAATAGQFVMAAE